MDSYYKNLDVWKKSIDIVGYIYSLSTKFPSTEIYGLTNQLRRASISIASNIAEGSGRSSDEDNVRFLYMSKGSAMEIETQLIIANKLGYIGESELVEIELHIESLLKMLTKYIQYKKNKKP